MSNRARRLTIFAPEQCPSSSAARSIPMLSAPTSSFTPPATAATAPPHPHRHCARHHAAGDFVELHQPDSRRGNGLQRRDARRNRNELHFRHGFVRRSEHFPKPGGTRPSADWNQHRHHHRRRRFREHVLLDEHISSRTKRRRRFCSSRKARPISRARTPTSASRQRPARRSRSNGIQTTSRYSPEPTAH